jgi:ketosteroid isomerase-like protein
MSGDVVRRRATVAALAGALALAGCGGGDRSRDTAADRVRAAVRAYLGALAAGDWDRACRLMTVDAQREVADAAGGPCGRALASGAAEGAEELASAQREVAGAEVRISGASATVGPLGAAQQDLRLQRVGGRWLVGG